MKAAHELRTKAIELRRIAMRSHTENEKRILLDIAFDCERAAKKLGAQSQAMIAGTQRERRRASFMRALSDHELLDLHAETSEAFRQGLEAESGGVFPEAEFDTWEEWSSAIEAELDQRVLTGR